MRLPILLSALLLAALLSACYKEGHGVFTDDFGVSGAGVPPASSPAPSASAEPIPVVQELSYEWPEGFAIAPDDAAAWYAPDYPYDPSSITLSRSDRDYGWDDVTGVSLGDHIKSELAASHPGADITLHSFAREEVSGLPAIRAVYGYETEDYPVYCTMLMVNADERYTFIFTDTTEGREWRDSFASAMASIAFITE